MSAPINISEMLEKDNVTAKKRRLECGDKLDVETNDTFSGFSVVKILREDSRHKVMMLQGKFEGSGDDAVLILEKQPFDKDGIDRLLSKETKTNQTLKNSIYTTFDTFPHSSLAGFKTTMIYPATEKHIMKYTDQDIWVVRETPKLYESVTLPSIEASNFSIQWVYNILEKKSEADRIVFEDADPACGFILLPDMKWDRKDLDSLYLVGIVNKRGIKSLRDLDHSSLPLLKNVLEKGKMDCINTIPIADSFTNSDDEHWNPSTEELTEMSTEEPNQTALCPKASNESMVTEPERKGLPCSFCDATFRRMPDLMKCEQRPSTPPSSPPSSLPSTLSESPVKRQRMINQVGGIGPAAPVTTPSNPYVFTKKVKTRKKTKAVDTTYGTKFNEQWQAEKLKDLHHNLNRMFEDVLKEATGGLQGSDVGRVIVHHDSLNSPIIVPLRSLSELNADVILSHIEKVIQSNDDLPLDASFNIQIGTIQIPKGGRSDITLTDLSGPNNSVSRKWSLIEIINEEDDLCISRAIRVAWAKLNCISNKEWQELMVGSYPKTPLIELILQHKKCPTSFYANRPGAQRVEPRRTRYQYLII